MSTTAPSSDARSDARTGRGWFDEVVFTNPEICSNCFARIRDRDENDTDTWGSGNRPESVLQRVGDGVVGHDCEVHDRYGAVRTYHSRTFCDQCGRKSGTARDDTLSKQEALGRVDALVRRLQEHGYAPAVERMYHAVGHLKSQPEYEAKDTEIFAAATAIGITHGRAASTAPYPVHRGYERDTPEQSDAD